MDSPNTLHRLPPKLSTANQSTNSLIYQNIEANKYFHSINNKTFRGRALIQHNFDLKNNNLKCVLLKINNDTNKIEETVEIEKFFEYEHGNKFGQRDEKDEKNDKNFSFRSLQSVNEKLDALASVLE